MTLKKILNLITIFCITILLSNTNLYSQKKSKNSITFDQALHESVEYREIGPFRGGRSAAVVGVTGQPDLYYFGATGGGVLNKDGYIRKHTIDYYSYFFSINYY